MSNVEEGLRLKKSLYVPMFFVLGLWLVKFFEFSFNSYLSDYGILPRTLHGLKGILISPFIHGDIFHLLSNTIPVLVLGTGLFYFYKRIALHVVLIIYMITGLLVWIFAREAYHIGASGIVYGLLAFLLISGFIRREPRTLAISFTVLVLYGGTLFSGILPGDEAISWESHLFGGIAGLGCALIYRNEHLQFRNVQKQELDESNQNAFIPKPHLPDHKEQSYIITFPLDKNH